MSNPFTSANTLYHFTSANALPAIAKHGLTIGDVPTDIVKWKALFEFGSLLRRRQTISA